MTTDTASPVPNKQLARFCKEVGICALRSAYELSEAVISGDAQKIAAANTALREALADFAIENSTDAGIAAIEAARDTYCNDEIEIDDTPLLSVGEDGTWVSAWLHVPHTGKNQEEDESEEQTA